MSLLSDIKNFLKKYIKNPRLVTIGAYLLWRYIKKQQKKESFMEAIKVVEDKPKYQIIYDTNENVYLLHYNDKVFSSDDKNKLKRMVK